MTAQLICATLPVNIGECPNDLCLCKDFLCVYHVAVATTDFGSFWTPYFTSFGHEKDAGNIRAENDPRIRQEPDNARIKEFERAEFPLSADQYVKTRDPLDARDRKVGEVLVSCHSATELVR
jgi:hypothetical protein